MKMFHLKISSCPFWDTCTYEGLNMSEVPPFIYKTMPIPRINPFLWGNKKMDSWKIYTCKNHFLLCKNNFSPWKIIIMKIN